MPRYNEILTEEFLDDAEACSEGIEFAKDNELIGLTIEEAILEAIRLKKNYMYIAWLLCLLNTSVSNAKVALYIADKHISTMRKSAKKDCYINSLELARKSLDTLAYDDLCAVHKRSELYRGGILFYMMVAVYSICYHGLTSYATYETFKRIEKKGYLVDCLNYALQLYKE